MRKTRKGKSTRGTHTGIHTNQHIVAPSFFDSHLVESARVHCITNRWCPVPTGWRTRVALGCGWMDWRSWLVGWLIVWLDFKVDACAHVVLVARNKKKVY
eukprot:6178384-Pleurochrysis_carterae.AAC.3